MSVATLARSTDPETRPDVTSSASERTRYVSASKLALAAVRKDGTIVTWGSPDHGGHLEE